MTVASTLSRWEYTGDGSTTEFPYTNKIFADSDLTVYVDGVLIPSGFTISGVGDDDGGDVEFATAPANDSEVTLVRAVPNTQDTDFPPAGAFPSLAVENAFDKLTVLVQQLLSQLGRQLQFPFSEQNAPSGELPSVAERAGKVLTFDQAGAPTAITEVDLGDAVTTADPITWSALQTFLDQIRLESASATASDPVPVLALVRTKVAAASDQIGRIAFTAKNDASEDIIYAGIRGEIADVADGSEDGRIMARLMVAGVERQTLQLGAGYVLNLRSYDSGAGPNPKLQLNNDKTVLDDGDALGQVDFRGNNDAAAKVSFASIDTIAESDAAGAEYGRLRFQQIRNGAQVVSLSPGVLMTTVATTSGTAVNFTGIPAGARKITVMFNSVSLDGTEELIVRLGTSGGIQSTSYDGSATQLNNAGAIDLVSFTTGFGVLPAGAAALDITGILTLQHMGSNVWVAAGTYTIANSGTQGRAALTAGVVTLSGELTQLRVTSTGTPDDLDAGSVNILVE